MEMEIYTPNGWVAVRDWLQAQSSTGVTVYSGDSALFRMGARQFWVRDHEFAHCLRRAGACWRQVMNGGMLQSRLFPADMPWEWVGVPRILGMGLVEA